jgi:methyl-accepting chemotaxis protein
LQSARFGTKLPQTTRFNPLRKRYQESVRAIKGIGDTINWMSQIASSITSAMEEQGTATREIANKTEQAAKGTAEVCNQHY